MSGRDGMAAPDVSVVIPTRDRSRLLALALRSALRQREVDLEVVVVDDGSGDDTPEVVAGLRDARVHLVRHRGPQGVAAARNSGIAAARGRWIAFLDDDDLWAPDKLARQLDAARRARRVWAYAGEVSVDERLRIVNGGPPAPPERVVELLARHNAVPAGASNVIVQADALARAGPFDTGLVNNEDWDMWIRLARLGPPAWVCHPLVALRIHPGNASRNMGRMLRELDVIERRHRIPVDRAAHYRWAAWTCLLAGEPRAALGFYARAVRAGDVRSLARIAVAVARPGVARRRAAQGAGPGPVGRAWTAEAQGWLDQLLPPDQTGTRSSRAAPPVGGGAGGERPR